jgi:hypothetical protein
MHRKLRRHFCDRQLRFYTRRDSINRACECDRQPPLRHAMLAPTRWKKRTGARAEPPDVDSATREIVARTIRRAERSEKIRAG